VNRFGDKLRRVLGEESQPGGERHEFEVLRRHEAVAAERREQDLPPGREQVTTHGAFYVREQRTHAAERHGSLVLAEALNANAEHLAVLAADEQLANLDLSRALFLDTETTGLAGGVGTFVFLTGLGALDDDGEEFHIEQVFLRTFAEEPAALRHIAERVRRAPALVTFSGKSFDRHRLADRMDLHRIDHDLREHPHLDLCYLNRLVYGGELPDGRLQTAERGLLGVRRESDLPGALCPQVYMAWRHVGCGDIGKVFEHNRLDILSLVTLMGHLARDPVATGERALLQAHAKRSYKPAPERAAELWALLGEREQSERARRRAERLAKRRARDGGG
jgi:uncharacterized protein YprB with RNaseH-like and TPR domain